MYSTLICAAIVATTTLVIAHSVCCWTDDIRGRDGTPTTEERRSYQIRKLDTKSNLSPRFLAALNKKNNSSESCISHVKVWREDDVNRVRYLEKDKHRTPPHESAVTDSVFMQFHHRRKLYVVKNVEPVTEKASNSIALAGFIHSHYIRSNRERLSPLDVSSYGAKATRQVKNEHVSHYAPFASVTNLAIAGNDMANSKHSFLWYRRKSLTREYRTILMSSGKDRVEVGTLRANEGMGSQVLLHEQSSSNPIIGKVEAPRIKKSTNDVLTPWKVQEGQDEVNPRIIGGQSANIIEFPFMAYLEIRGKYRCCMSIMTATWLLTAAHCVIDPMAVGVSLNGFGVFALKDIAVFAGTPFVTTNLTRRCANIQERRGVARLVLHPDFKILGLRNDLALMAVKSPLPFNYRIQPAKLPRRSLDPKRDMVEGHRCYLTGWGQTRTLRHIQDEPVNRYTTECKVDRILIAVPMLQKVTLPLLSFPNCRKMYPWAADRLKESEHICTLSRNEKDACHGDSGAPLTCDGNVVAVMSWGAGCANKSNPSVFSRIDNRLAWIIATTGYSYRSQASRPPDITVINLIAVGLPATALGSIRRL